MRSGYYHISLSENSKAKTAFVTPFGKYQFEAVPFGLAQAPAYFQQLISIVLQGCSDFALAHLDDIIIFSKNEAEYLKHIEIIFQKLKEAGLKLKESKCDFFKKEILATKQTLLSIVSINHVMLRLFSGRHKWIQWPSQPEVLEEGNPQTF